MDELSEEDKLTVARARKLQRFLSQPFHVAEVFTGARASSYSSKTPSRALKASVDGDYDDHRRRQPSTWSAPMEQVIEKAQQNGSGSGLRTVRSVTPEDEMADG